MRRMTGRNGFIFVAAACVGLVVSSARCGSLDAPAAPTSSNSAMFTLNDIYNKLDTRAAVAMRTNVFAEPGGEATTGTMHTLNDIMTLATNRAPVPKTERTTSYAARDDGALQIGVAQPNPRFTTNGAPGTAATNQIRDNLTGLIWARNANLASNTLWSVNGTCTWATAFDVVTNSAGPVNGAGYGGTNDWRLPNLWELRSLLTLVYTAPALCNTAGTGPWTEGNPFTGVVGNGYYWTSSHDAQSPDTTAWYVNVGTDYTSTSLMTSMYYVWPVRGGGQ